SQDKRTDPWDYARHAHPGPNHRREAISHPGKVFFKMLDDFAGVAERWQHIDKAEHLHLKTLIAHGERHHPLIKTGLAEKRLRMFVDQLKNARTALLDLALKRLHLRK